ncbi:hypothetical protein OQZ33_00190 [Pedobacter sp. MC2016-05]|uniref:hypothetical protein n=1 Tax=Pedobacter sp. MC2016-05 TaxID=2994474 RepID=UPI0022459E59|nr:hypothetical protein [Pedobacter sp. MC2016-05]MCX2472738.1 hypothetical protein [Pedobacter sp. MC2016-05]
MSHTFHIPVLGLGYSIDTPLKVARYGISSTLSIVDDELIERMRAYHLSENGQHYSPIPKTEADYRSKRITAYLNFIDQNINSQFEQLKQSRFIPGSEICKYFELLPESSPLKHGYELMMEYPEGESKRIFQDVLRKAMKIGAADVNIMAKVDKMNFVNATYTGDENTDALAAFRGFANSTLNAAVILSAGMNPRLYSYIEHFSDFLPDDDAHFKKKIILKVSDFRSAAIQAKFLAKKGVWVSEFRIESGLNCGGHAFATEGYLLGPILEEFKTKRTQLVDELFTAYQSVLSLKGINLHQKPDQSVSVQGGIGTAEEQNFLLNHYQLSTTGWGSPFLLVPEVTNVDQRTLDYLAAAKEEDFYLSNSSPLGVRFNNFKNSTSDVQRRERIDKGRPGSACTKKYLCNNTEFTIEPICTASREYQHLKIKQLQSAELSLAEYESELNKVTEKVCLCEGLCASAYLKCDIIKPKESKAVSICPGPNLAYFNNSYTLGDMVGHIYGKTNLLANTNRPHVFINELNLYIDYLQAEIKDQLLHFNDKKRKQLANFKKQLNEGITYYKNLFAQAPDLKLPNLSACFNLLEISQLKLNQLSII